MEQILNTTTAKFIPNMFINIVDTPTAEEPVVKYTDDDVNNFIRNCIDRSWSVNNNGFMDIYPCTYDDVIQEDSLAEIVGKWFYSDYDESLETVISDYIYKTWDIPSREYELLEEVRNEAEKLDDEEFIEMITAKLDEYGIDALYDNGFKGAEYSAADFLPNTIKINLILATPAELNYDFSAISDSYMNPDTTNCKNDIWDNALTWLIEQQGYSVDDVTNMIRYGDKPESKFINSVYEALCNAYDDTDNAVTILCHCEGEDFFKMMQDLKTAKQNTYTVSESAYCGLYIWYPGCGSCMEIELEKDVVIPAKMIHHFQIEARKPFMTNYGYSVNDVMDLCGGCWRADVKITENS